MKIEKVALIGAGAVGAYFIWGLSEKMGEHFQVIAEGERKERLRENGIIINGKRYIFPVNTAKDAGNMIEMGAEYGILVPYCEYTYHMIKAMEEKNDGKFEY